MNSSEGVMITLVDHGLTTAIDLLAMKALDRTSVFGEEVYVFSWVQLNSSSYALYLEWFWYDSERQLARNDAGLYVGRTVFAYSSMFMEKGKVGSWRVNIFAAPVDDNLDKLREHRALLCSESFQVGGKAVVKVSGLPDSSSTRVFSQGRLLGTVSAKKGLVIPLALNSSLLISVDEYIYLEPSRRYFCPNNVLSVVSDSSYTFNYTAQYYVSAVSKRPIYIATGWYDHGHTLKLFVKSPIIEENGVRHLFVRWQGLSGPNSSPELSATVDRPLNITALWKTQFFLSVSSKFGTPYGDGWYDEGTVAKFSLKHDLAGASMHVFEGWEGDSSEASLEGSLLMDGPKKVTARWTTNHGLLGMLVALTAFAFLPLAMESVWRGAFTAMASSLLGCIGWLILNSLLGPGSTTLISFSILIATIVFVTVLLLPLERRQPLLAAATVTSVLLIQELFLNDVNAFYGFLIALAGMVGFPLAGALIRRDKQLGYALQVTGLVFASRVAYVPFPQKFLNVSMGLPAIYLLISAMYLLFILVKKVDLRSLGLQLGKTALPSQIFAGLSIGMLSGAVEYLLLKPPAISPIGNLLQSAVYIIFLMMVLVGLSEEILFRGLVQKSISNILPPWAAIQVASIQFGLMHLGWRNPIEVLFAYGMGVIMGFMFWKTESLIAPILIHGVGNVVMFSLASLNFNPTILTLQLAAGSAASTIASLYILRKGVPLDEWSASMEIRRRVRKMKQLAETN